MDTTGTVSWSRVKTSLAKNGRLLLVSADLCQILQMVFTPKSNGKKGIAGYSPERAEDLHFLSELAQAGRFKPVIDRTYQFNQMKDAHAHVDTGRKKGNVVASVN